MNLRETVRRLTNPMARSRSHALVLYGKPGCHLCDDAEVLLTRLKRRHQFSLEKVDITSDPALFRQYDIRIPVIVVDGQDEVDAPIGEDELRRLLR